VRNVNRVQKNWSGWDLGLTGGNRQELFTSSILKANSQNADRGLRYTLRADLLPTMD